MSNCTCARCGGEVKNIEDYIARLGVSIICQSCACIEVRPVQDVPDELTCNKCGETKPIGEFSIAENLAFGRSRECRECTYKRHKRYQENKKA